MTAIILRCTVTLPGAVTEVTQVLPVEATLLLSLPPLLPTQPGLLFASGRR